MIFLWMYSAIAILTFIVCMVESVRLKDEAKALWFFAVMSLFWPAAVVVGTAELLAEIRRKAIKERNKT